MNRKRQGTGSPARLGRLVGPLAFVIPIAAVCLLLFSSPLRAAPDAVMRMQPTQSAVTVGALVQTTLTSTSDPNWTLTATSTPTPTATPYRIYLPLVFKQFDPTQPPNLLRNPDFEEGFSERGTGEITVANAWEPWWVQGSEEQTSQGYLVRPEYKPEDGWVFTMRRVHSGRFSQKYFSTYSTHIAGIYQQVAVTKGSLVTFSIWIQVWSSTEPDPNQCEGFGNYDVSVGIDPYGGIDGTSSNIVWSDPVMSCNEWVHLTVSTVAQADRVTVFTKGAPEFRVKFNDSYWDDAVLTGSLPRPGPAH